MRTLQLLALDRNFTVIGVTRAMESGYGRERIVGSNRWIRLASTVVIADPGSTADTIAVSLNGPNLKHQEFDLALPENRTECVLEISWRAVLTCGTGHVKRYR